MNRETQIRVMEETEERARQHLSRWLSNPEFAAALHAYDHEVMPEPRKACGQR